MLHLSQTYIKCCITNQKPNRQTNFTSIKIQNLYQLLLIKFMLQLIKKGNQQMYPSVAQTTNVIQA